MDGSGGGSDDRAVKKFKPTAQAVRGRGAGPVKPSGRGRPLSAPATATKEATPVGKQSQGLGRGLMGQAARAAANSSKGAARAEAGLAGPAGWSGAAATGMGTEADDGFAGTFARELPAMMYGFGDDEAPLQETVEVVEAALLQYLGSVAHRAAGVAATSLKPKPDDRDVLFVVRKDPVKFARIKELLMMDHLIKDVRSLKSDMDELK